MVSGKQCALDRRYEKFYNFVLFVLSKRLSLLLGAVEYAVKKSAWAGNR